VAPWEGFEPPTNWLTANCSTTELPRNAAEDFKLLLGKFAKAAHAIFQFLRNQQGIFKITNKKEG
jgi:hypothetical protein